MYKRQKKCTVKLKIIHSPVTLNVKLFCLGIVIIKKNLKIYVS